VPLPPARHYDVRRLMDAAEAVVLVAQSFGGLTGKYVNRSCSRGAHDASMGAEDDADTPPPRIHEVRHIHIPTFI